MQTGVLTRVYGVNQQYSHAVIQSWAFCGVCKLQMLVWFCIDRILKRRMLKLKDYVLFCHNTTSLMMGALVINTSTHTHTRLTCYTVIRCNILFSYDRNKWSSQLCTWTAFCIWDNEQVAMLKHHYVLSILHDQKKNLNYRTIHSMKSI